MVINKNTERKIAVFADWEEISTPFLMGYLRSSPLRGKEVFSFATK